MKVKLTEAGKLFMNWSKKHDEVVEASVEMSELISLLEEIAYEKAFKKQSEKPTLCNDPNYMHDALKYGLVSIEAE